MRRNLIGILAAVLLLLGGVTALTGPGGSSAAGFAGGCIRVGLVLGAIWLAMPQIQALLLKAPGWLLGWFVGKGKPSNQKGEGQSPVRTLQPRRRGRT